jgi:hypothetical protein
MGLRIRKLFFSLKRCFISDEGLKNRLEMYRVVVEWNRRLDPVRFIETGEEPDVGHAPLVPPPVIQEPY